jgi:hypothetical protein
MTEQWRIVSEGVLALEGTGYEIRHESMGAMSGGMKVFVFRIYHHGNAPAGLWTYRLQGAKQAVLSHMREMIEMGIEP